MQTKEYFSQELRTRLNTPIWEDLKRGLLGNELIEYGANVLELQYLGYYTLYRQSFPQTADFKGLAMQSFFARTSFDPFRVAFLKLEIDVSATPRQIWEPYSLQASVGSITWYNVETVKRVGNTLTVYLYQGIASATYHNGYSHPELSLAPFAVANSTNFDFYKVPTAAETSDFYVKLERNVLSKSIIVNDNLRIYPNQYSNIYNMTTEKSYWCCRAEDLCLNVFISAPTLQQEFRVTFLRNTYLKRNNQAFKVVDSDTNPTTSSNLEYTNFTIISEYDGKEEDLAYAQFSMLANLSAHSAVATKAQVESFIKSYPTVIDAKVTTRPGIDGNLVQAYVKPRVITDTDFSDIVADLLQFGEVITNYELFPGRAVFFDVLLSGEYSPSVITWLENRLSYESLMINDSVTVAAVMQELKVLAPGAVVSFRLTLENNAAQQASQSINSVVRTNTVEMFDAAGNLQVWDYYGFLYSNSASSIARFGQLFPIGEDYVAVYGDNIYVYSDQFSRVAVFDKSQIPFQNVAKSILALESSRPEEVLVQLTDGTLQKFRTYQFQGTTNITKTLLSVVQKTTPSAESGISAIPRPWNSQAGGSASEIADFLAGSVWLTERAGLYRVVQEAASLGMSWQVDFYQFDATRTSFIETDLYQAAFGPTDGSNSMYHYESLAFVYIDVNEMIPLGSSYPHVIVGFINDLDDPVNETLSVFAHDVSLTTNTPSLLSIVDSFNDSTRFTGHVRNAQRFHDSKWLYVTTREWSDPADTTKGFITRLYKTDMPFNQSGFSFRSAPELIYTGSAPVSNGLGGFKSETVKMLGSDEVTGYVWVSMWDEGLPAEARTLHFIPPGGTAGDVVSIVGGVATVPSLAQIGSIDYLDGSYQWDNLGSQPAMIQAIVDGTITNTDKAYPVLNENGIIAS